jgi:hypothetical protein
MVRVWAAARGHEHLPTPEGHLIDLKKQFGAEHKVVLDESANVAGQSAADRRWLQQIPCKYGHVYLHGEDTLGAYAEGRKIAGKLAALPGVRVHQRGDREVTVVFPPAVFPAVAALLRPRRRRRLSPEQAAAGAARLAPYHFQKA